MKNKKPLPLFSLLNSTAVSMNLRYVHQKTQMHDFVFSTTYIPTVFARKLSIHLDDYSFGGFMLLCADYRGHFVLAYFFLDF